MSYWEKCPREKCLRENCPREKWLLGRNVLHSFKTMNDWNSVKLNFSSLEPQLLSICRTAAKNNNQTSIESIDISIGNR